MGPKVIVADANLLVCLHLPGPMLSVAQRLRATEKDWICPSLVRSELLSVLCRYVRRGVIDRDQAARSYRRALDMVQISPMQPSALDVLNLAVSSGCTTYDIEYVWLAEHLNLRLVTSDTEVLAAFPALAVHPFYAV